MSSRSNGGASIVVTAPGLKPVVETSRSWPPSMRLLRFADPAVEAEFLAEYRQDAARFVGSAIVVALVLMLGFMWEDNQISALGYRATNMRIYLAVPLCVGAWFVCRRAWARRFIEWITAGFIIAYACLVAAICLVFEPGPYGLSGPVGAGNFLILILAAFTFSYLRFFWSLTVGVVVLLVYLIAVFAWTAGDFSEFLFGNFANAVYALVLGGASSFMFERLRRQQYLAARKITEETARYKELLYTLVPPSIARRIEGGESPIADAQHAVAILFSDLVGFSRLTKGIPPITLVQLLNELFSEFDHAAERHGVEKIKTIGDGYMAVCGPPVDEDVRTVSVVGLATEMIQITRTVADKYALPIDIRIGIHTGNLIAGVIGKSRYAYDMWGDSVNLASRMESSGMTNRVQLSEQAYHCLRDTCRCEDRGEIEIKGLGTVRSYLLVDD